MKFPNKSALFSQQSVHQVQWWSAYASKDEL